MSHDEIVNLHKAIAALKKSNDDQFKALNEKIEPVINAYTTIKQGSEWIKYGLGILAVFFTVMGTIAALLYKLKAWVNH